MQYVVQSMEKARFLGWVSHFRSHLWSPLAAAASSCILGIELLTNPVQLKTRSLYTGFSHFLGPGSDTYTTELSLSLPLFLSPYVPLSLKEMLRDILLHVPFYN